MCKVVEKRLKEHVFFQKSDFQLFFHSNIAWRTYKLRRKTWKLKMSSCKFLPALPMFNRDCFAALLSGAGKKTGLMLLIPGDLFATSNKNHHNHLDVLPWWWREMLVPWFAARMPFQVVHVVFLGLSTISAKNQWMLKTGGSLFGNLPFIAQHLRP